MEAQNNRSITLSTKVTAEQKAVFANIAAKNNISLSEWMASLLEIHKDSYDKIGDPTQRESNLEIEIQKKDNQVKRLKALLDSADHKAQVEINRADNAITRRDVEILKNKELTKDNIKVKNELEKQTELLNKNIDIQNNDETKSLLLPIVLVSGFIGLTLSKR